MTTATAPKAVKNREAELTEEIRRIEQEIAGFEEQAQACEALALELNGKRVALLDQREPGDRELRELKHAIADAEQDAADYRERGRRRALQADLAAIRSERDALAIARREREAREAETAQADRMVAELADARETLVRAMIATEIARDTIQRLHREHEAIRGRDVRTSSGARIASHDFLPGHIEAAARDEARRRHEAR